MEEGTGNKGECKPRENGFVAARVLGYVLAGFF